MPERRGCPFQRGVPKSGFPIAVSSDYFCSDIISHHAPYKTSQFTCNCRYSSITLFPFVQHSIVFSTHAFVCFVGIGYHGRIVALLTCNKILRFKTDTSFAYTLSCFNQNRSDMFVSSFCYAQAIYINGTGSLAWRQSNIGRLDVSLGETGKISRFYDQ